MEVDFLVYFFTDYIIYIKQKNVKDPKINAENHYTINMESLNYFQNVILYN